MKSTKSDTETSSESRTPSQLIDGRIADLGDWRGEKLAKVREIVHRVVPDVVEEWKWRGVPVWSHNGILFTGESYKDIVKLTFFKGASLPDPGHLFNSSLDGNARRAIDFHKDDPIDEKALEALIMEAVAANAPKPKRSAKA